MDTQIIPNFLTKDEIDFLLSYYQLKPYTTENTKEYQGQQVIFNRHKISNIYNWSIGGLVGNCIALATFILPANKKKP